MEDDGTELAITPPKKPAVVNSAAAHLREQIVQINAAGTFSSISSSSSGADQNSSSGGSPSSSAQPPETPPQSDQLGSMRKSQSLGGGDALTATVEAAATPDSALAVSPEVFREREDQDFFYGEPEWQRAPGRWAPWEATKLREMRRLLQEDLRAAPPFPEVVGSRRMLRFLRGHKHDPQKAAEMMQKMLKWRKENRVDAIREDIMKNKKFFPRQFPDGEMITKLYPLLVANPLCIDASGGPISYESYAFSPRKVAAQADGDLAFFIKFHIYCQEFKQICLDSLSDAKEMENLARIAKERSSTASPPPPPPSPSPRAPASPGNPQTPPTVNANGRPGTSAGGVAAATGRGSKSTPRRRLRSPWERQVGRPSDGAGGGGGSDEAPGVTGAPAASELKQEPSRGEETRSDAAEQVTPRAAPAEGPGKSAAPGVSGKDDDGKGLQEEGEAPGDGEEGDDGQERWGVLLRNTIIRDLSGFGMEHAGPIGRSLISKVLAVSQDNYPEMMEKCYIINAPWIFYALWKGLTPLVSANTAKKVQVLNNDFLPTLRKTMAMDRLPITAGGRCDPDRVTLEQMEDFVVCGQVLDVLAGGQNGGGTAGEGIGDEIEVDRALRGPSPTYLDSEEGDGSDEDLDNVDITGDSRSRAGRASRSRRSRRCDAYHENGYDEEGQTPTSNISSSGGGGGGGVDRGRSNGVEGRRRGPFSFFKGLQQTPESFLADDTRSPRRSVPLARASSLGNPSTKGIAAGASPNGDGDPRHRFRRDGDPRRSPGSNRPFASPGPRGVRRGLAGGGGGRVRLRGIGGAGDGSEAGGRDAGGLSPVNDSQTEDFDGQLVDRALELSINRKARRFSRSYDGSDVYNSTGTPSELSLEDEEDKGGWVRRKWRGLRERRESKKLAEKGLLGDQGGVAISAGDCAEWVPNSERDSCLHCERPFTLLLRRHHCRMCGELVCGQCSPHRVRLHPENGNGSGANGSTSSHRGGHHGDHAACTTDGGSGGAGGEGVERSRRKVGGGHHRKTRRRKGSVAVRVCTDCHFSLRTITVASSASLVEDTLGGEPERRTRDGSGAARAAGLANGDEDGRIRASTDGDNGLGAVGTSRGAAGHRWRYVREVEVDAPLMDISGDVLVEDVLEWHLIQQRVAKACQVFRMCLLVVIEMHHALWLETAAATWCAAGATLIDFAYNAASTTFTALVPGSNGRSDDTEAGGDRAQGEEVGPEIPLAISAAPAAVIEEAARLDAGERTNATRSRGASRAGAAKPGAADLEAKIWAALDVALDEAPLWFVLVMAVVPWCIGLWWWYHY